MGEGGMETKEQIFIEQSRHIRFMTTQLRWFKEKCTSFDIHVYETSEVQVKTVAKKP